MSYGQYHSLPPAPPKEKYVFGLGLIEMLWVFGGVALSYKMMGHVPPLPFSNIVFKGLHYTLPTLFFAFFAFGKHPTTGLSLLQEIKNYFLFQRRKKVLIYKR